MTRQEAIVIISTHSYHCAELTEAIRAQNAEAIDVHQKALQIMQSDYEQATNYILQLLK